MNRIKTWFKSCIAFFVRKPVITSVLLAFILGLGYCFILYIQSRIASGDFTYFIKDFIEIATIGTLVGFFLIYPLVLSVINLVILFFPKKRMAFIELITLAWGAFCTAIYLPFEDVFFSADWNVQLQNAQRHTPIFTQTFPTVITLICIAAAGYLILHFVPLKKLPPLVIACSFAALYLGMFTAVLWTIQLWGEWYPILYSANCILVMLKLMQYKIGEWTDVQQIQTDEYTESVIYSNRLLNACHHFLMNSQHWPIAGLVLALPLLGILIGILVLFGQQPDAFIKAWTETSDWTLSAQTAPQNLIVDEHYLCTVAAGGHRRIVKPLRMGERHGHAVVVNRQLMIANAFEQLLEERTPRFHRHVRHFYDTYGFPVAKLIHSRYAADAVYFIMKPLEWLFLIVLYLFDVKPENRIAVQYLPKRESAGS
ncbi:MAG: hypothetical protein HDR21_06410 [Lachnospiraceae bacterium]|nr:hypothetical protein [Lachnospiraceae bacterium]